jgi:hypothetical protein
MGHKPEPVIMAQHYVSCARECPSPGTKCTPPKEQNLGRNQVPEGTVDPGPPCFREHLVLGSFTEPDTQRLPKTQSSIFFVIFKVLNRNRNISTSQLKQLLALHLKPINVIISHGS